jgi:tRNA (guanine-N7-)-methyltransferase
MQLVESNTSHSDVQSRSVPGARAPFFVNPYIRRMELQDDWVYTEEMAKAGRGQWSQKIPNARNAVHVEIGTGNGFHFAEYAKTRSDVAFLGFEIKYKTLVQSIERARDVGATRARMIKADARQLSQYFAPQEVEKVIVHFPDPWPKRRQQKNRLLNKAFFRELEVVLKTGGELEFKTDHYGYFLFAARNAAESQLTMVHYTEDLHHSFAAGENFVTAFEALFLKKGQSIFSFKLRKDF